MATFYVTSAGSDVFPYDTLETGATSLNTVLELSSLSAGDTVYIASDLTVDNISNITKPITLTSIDDTKYKITSTANGYCIPIMFGNYESHMIVDGLAFEGFWQLAYPAFPDFIYSLIIRNCYFALTGYGPILTLPFSFNFVFENNVVRSTNVGIGNFFVMYTHAYGLKYLANVSNNVFDFDNFPSYFGFFWGFGDPAYWNITNNILYVRNETSDPAYFINPDFTRQETVLLENNSCNFLTGYVKPVDGNPYDVSTTNTIYADPMFVGDGSGGYDDYYLSPSSPLIGTGYNNIQIGLGLISFSINVLTSTKNVSQSYIENFCNVPTNTISILEKVARLTDLFDPWLMPIDKIQYYANNLGYDVGLNRDDIGVGGEVTADVPESLRNKYLRFMASQLPEWYRTKTTRPSIRTMLYSFGLVGDIVYYYTKEYTDKFADAVLSNQNDKEVADFLSDVREGNILTYDELRKQLCTLRSNIDTVVSLLDRNVWMLSRTNTASIEEDISNIPDTYFPTPHFRVMFDLLSSFDAQTYTKDLTRHERVVRAISTIKPINTVFEGVAAYMKVEATRYVMATVRVRKNISLISTDSNDNPD